MECVGSVESGLQAMRWSPDQELLILITGIVLMPLTLHLHFTGNSVCNQQLMNCIMGIKNMLYLSISLNKLCDVQRSLPGGSHMEDQMCKDTNDCKTFTKHFHLYKERVSLLKVSSLLLWLLCVKSSISMDNTGTFMKI